MRVKRGGWGFFVFAFGLVMVGVFPIIHSEVIGGVGFLVAAVGAVVASVGVTGLRPVSSLGWLVLVGAGLAALVMVIGGFICCGTPSRSQLSLIVGAGIAGHAWVFLNGVWASTSTHLIGKALAWSSAAIGSISGLAGVLVWWLGLEDPLRTFNDETWILLVAVTAMGAVAAQIILGVALIMRASADDGQSPDA